MKNLKQEFLIEELVEGENFVIAKQGGQIEEELRDGLRQQ